MEADHGDAVRGRAVKRTGTKLILRVLQDDDPGSVADEIRNWVEKEMIGREFSDRDTEIVVVIGMDPT